LGTPPGATVALHDPSLYFDRGLSWLSFKALVHARRGGQARIIIKCNALTDHRVIRLLYRASEAYLRDNVQARILRSDGTYGPVGGDDPTFDAQLTLMSRRLRATLAGERLGDQLHQ